MSNKQLAAMLDIIRDKSYEHLTKEELDVLVQAANILRETQSN